MGACNTGEEAEEACEEEDCVADPGQGHDGGDGISEVDNGAADDPEEGDNVNPNVEMTGPGVPRRKELLDSSTNPVHFRSK